MHAVVQTFSSSFMVGTGCALLITEAHVPPGKVAGRTKDTGVCMDAFGSYSLCLLIKINNESTGRWMHFVQSA